MISAEEQAARVIAVFAQKILFEMFGYCGVADGKTRVMLNSGNTNVIVEIKWEPPTGEEG